MNKRQAKKYYKKRGLWAGQMRINKNLFYYSIKDLILHNDIKDIGVSYDRNRTKN